MSLYMVVIEDAHGMFFSDPEFVDTLQEAREMKAGIEARGRMTEEESRMPTNATREELEAALKRVMSDARMHPGHEVMIYECRPIY